MPFDGSQLDDVTRLLIVGRAKIENRWCQGAFMKPGGAVCMLGAVGWNEVNIDAAPFEKEVEARLTRAIGGGDVSAWNDELGRTKGEVLAAYDRAIANVY